MSGKHKIHLFLLLIPLLGGCDRIDSGASREPASAVGKTESQTEAPSSSELPPKETGLPADTTPFETVEEITLHDPLEAGNETTKESENPTEPSHEEAEATSPKATSVEASSPSTQETEPPLLSSYTPPVTGEPGKTTVLNFLKTAMMPVGRTLYTFGGGWNAGDTGAGSPALSLGYFPAWDDFFTHQNTAYSYQAIDTALTSGFDTTLYVPGAKNPLYAYGLDCSGYVGWTLYNLFETENGKEGFVCKASAMAKSLSEKGLGSFSPGLTEQTQLLPGDIISLPRHVYICLGTCKDQSVLILHSTPSESFSGAPGGGVQLGAIGTSEDCEAYHLADTVMKTMYPEWSARYPVILLNPANYLRLSSPDKGGRFTFSSAVLSDPEGIREKRPEEILLLLFSSS